MAVRGEYNTTSLDATGSVSHTATAESPARDTDTMQLNLSPRLTAALRHVADRENATLAEIGIIARATPTGCGLALLESAIRAKYPLAFDRPATSEATATQQEQQADDADNEPERDATPS